MKLTWLKSSKGNSEIPLIIIVIIGAFFLAGGQYMFQGLTSTDDTSINPGSGSAPLPSSDWSIELEDTTCDSTSNLSKVTVVLHGPSAGYYTITIDSQVASTNVYTPSAQNNQTIELPLSNNLGFNTKPWIIKLFSGIIPVGTNTSTPQTQKDMEPTSCT